MHMLVGNEMIFIGSPTLYSIVPLTAKTFFNVARGRWGRRDFLLLI